jgi:hypothetical protein
MSILNRPSDGLPSVLVALVRTLDAEGKMAKQKLIGLCAPKSLFEGRDDSQKMANQTLKRWTQIGLFEEGDDRVSLAKAFKKKTDVCAFSGLREHLLQLVLKPENNKGFLEKEPPSAGDFTYTAAWVLLQDIYSLPDLWSAIETLMNKQIKRECSMPIQNDTRWGGFRAWASFLGLGLPVDGITIDVTLPVRSALAEVLPHKGELAVSDMRDGLGSRFPILDGGEYHIKVRARFKEGELPLAKHHLSPALSAALLRLEHEGLIDLVRKDDAPSMELTGRGYSKLRPVSHVKRRQGL